MNAALLKELIDLESAFEQQFPNPEEQQVDRFVQWLKQQVPAKPDQSTTPDYGNEYLPPLPPLPTYIAQCLVLGYRYHKSQIKKALHNTPLITYDDFIYLALLAMNGSMTKMNLVESTVNEKASGVLVINRLLKQDFVRQTPDPNDQRVRQITLAPSGQEVLNEVLPVVARATTLLVGDLSQQEQQTLADLLTRLDRFHNPLYLHDKDTPLDELYQRLTDATSRA